MTQEELAKDIVSVSYLSKIERNAADANPQVVKQICERLGIKPERTQDNHIQKEVHQWFNQLLNGELIRAYESYQMIEAEIESIIDAGLYWLVELHTLYYFVLTDREELAERKYIFLQQDIDKFNEIEHYYWLKFSGLYFADRYEYYDAFQSLMRAEKMYPKEHFQDELEIHDLYFQIAKVSTNLYYTYHARVYINRALTFYKNTYRLRRCGESHLIVGITAKRMNEINEAIEHFRLAKKLSETIKDDHLLIDYHRAMGDVYRDMQLNDEAIEYYKRTYELTKHHYSERELQAIMGLCRSYAQKGDNDSAAYWCEVAQQLIQTGESFSQLLSYEVNSYYYILHGFDQGFESLMVNDVLPFLKEKQLHYTYAHYLKLTANYYYNERKYKVSADYYAAANELLDVVRVVDNY